MLLVQFVLFSIFIQISQSLVCHSCDSFLSCNEPFPQECPPHSKCYTLSHGPKVLAKGCAHSCDSLGEVRGGYCVTCHHKNFCNEIAHGIGQGVVIRESPGIGQGVGYDNGYHIGRGVTLIFKKKNAKMPKSKLRRFGDQNYEKLKKTCVVKSHLFVDTLFPPTNESLFLEEGRSSDIVWKRPAELHDDPHLFVEGASANDVTQGILGNCWFVSACSALTHNQLFLDRVIPDAEEQEWSAQNKYCGIFRFRFWRFGEWVEVVIDDLLPTREGKLLFARSKTPNEFWSALLEKAFAKLYGCYENLVGGHLADALQDVSGGVAETLHVNKFLKDDPKDKQLKLFTNVKTAFDGGALVVAAIAARTKDEIEQTLDCGLVKGHAYAVSAVLSLDLENKSLTSFLTGSHQPQYLIRLQNPWGEKEWNGAWSDNSSEWLNVSDKQKKEMGMSVEEDGDFWMPWESFVQYFTDISLCQLFNTSAFSTQPRYKERVIFSEWSSNGKKSGAPDDRAGGCLNFQATFCNNPQYAFDCPGESSTFIFALTQADPSEGLKKREPFVTIGMHVMRIESNRKHRVHQAMTPIATSEYASGRSVYMHLDGLPKGRYMLTPTTFAPKEIARFMLRIYSDRNVQFEELIKHAPKVGFMNCKAAHSVTRITLHGVTMNSSEADRSIYAILSDSGKSYRTKNLSGDKIVWNEQFVFHKAKNRQEYKLTIWEDRTLAKDRQLAQTTIVALIDNESRDTEVNLYKDSNEQIVIGTAKITVSAFDDPMYL
ncbi:unnamed protein product [Caenorhabditis angaria]|uniref:Calpain catalytic domain-containing protein n=1 Tax=Caenorhabditis angaria TaxID=860376 RepID=A0A9P1N291_9PELO|nr:unnamed protein product [Caenorhabditis angaria]